jgi:hypothetical protein
MRKNVLVLLLFSLTGCAEKETGNSIPGGNVLAPLQPLPDHVGEIDTPGGFWRNEAAIGSFEYWLRKLPLKKDNTVYLYNGRPKSNQAAQFSVLDISTGKTDLQQCADVVMRLRAEYLFAARQYDSIRFMDYNGKWYNWSRGDNRAAFDAYLKEVFGWCGTASLEKQLPGVADFSSVKTGDVLVQGGFPGHAMLVADMAINEKGEKIFLLVQGYQPAQDMHVVVNPVDKQFSPWYRVPEGSVIITPEWSFYKNHLHRW